MSESSVHGLDDTVRFATGFAVGGLIAVHAGLGYTTIIALTLAFIVAEVVYAMGSVYYEAWQLNRDSASDE